MARYRRMNMAIRPVDRIKHVVDKNATLTAAATVVENLIVSVDAPTLANVTQVKTGSTVNGIYLRVEVAGNESDVGAIPQVYMAVVKNPGDNLAVINPASVGADDNKRYVIHQEMVMLQNAVGGNARTLFNGVIVIPKGYKRFGPNDKLTINLRSPQLNIAYCIQCHYKEFR